MDFTLRLRILFCLVFGVMPLTQARAVEPCLSFEPDVVSIQGMLERRVFPGVPGFEDLTTGDEPEVGFYLALDSPLCMAGNDDEEALSVDDDVRLIQLVLDQPGYDALRPLLGETVTLKGSLFGAVSGHHHTEVLLQQVEKLEGEASEPIDCEVLDENIRLDNGGYRPLLQGTIIGSRRAYFHDAPHASCSAQKAYVVAGDTVQVSMGTDSAWIYGTYTAKNGKQYAGWLDQAQVVLNSCPSCEQPADTLDSDVREYLDVVELCTATPESEVCMDLEVMWHPLREKYRNNQPVLKLLGDTWPQQ